MENPTSVVDVQKNVLPVEDFEDAVSSMFVGGMRSFYRLISIVFSFRRKLAKLRDVSWKISLSAASPTCGSL